MSYPTLTDAVSAFKNGDQSAFQDVYDGSVRYIYYTIVKSVQNRDLADDILQETYIEIYKNISSLKEPEAFKGWSSVIAQNKISRYFRKKSETIFSSEEEMDTVMESMEEDDEAMLPEDAADNRETQRLIMDIINSLPDAQKEAVISFYYNQMSISEIAGAMEVPENTVKTWLSRGKKKIKEEVITLAEKHGTKLYAAPLMLILSGIFANEAKACELPVGGYMLISSQIASEAAVGVGASAGTAGVQTTAGAAAGKAAAVTAATATKAAGINWGIFAAIGLAVGVAGAGTAIGVHLAGGNSPAVEAEISEEELMKNNNLFGGSSDQGEVIKEEEPDNNLFGSTQEAEEEEEETTEAVIVETPEKEKKEKKEKPKEEPGEPVEEEAEEDAYEIPEVISRLQKKSEGMFSDLFIDGDELEQIYSTGPIVDKGDYYEVQDTRFWFYDHSFTDWEELDDDYPLIDKGYGPVNLRIRKNGTVIDTYDTMTVNEFTVDEYFKRYGHFSRPEIGVSLYTSTRIKFDSEGYLVEFCNYAE